MSINSIANSNWASQVSPASSTGAATALGSAFTSALSAGGGQTSTGAASSVIPFQSLSAQLQATLVQQQEAASVTSTATASSTALTADGSTAGTSTAGTATQATSHHHHHHGGGGGAAELLQALDGSSTTGSTSLTGTTSLTTDPFNGSTGVTGTPAGLTSTPLSGSSAATSLAATEQALSADIQQSLQNFGNAESASALPNLTI